MRDSSIEGTIAVLELIASERPQLLDLQLDTVLNSPMRFAAHNLASALGVPVEQMGATIYQACHHLDRLEKRRGHWRDPSAVLESPNVAARKGSSAAVQRRFLDGI